MKTRFNFRVKLRDWTFFAMIAKTQKLEGVTSVQSDGSHIVMWDLEKCTLEQAKKSLLFVQEKYGLSHIYIVSDVIGSYRAWCFSKVDFKTLLHILLDTDFVDPVFFDYTVKRKKATLRTSNKKGRPPQQLVSVILSYPAAIPETAEKVTYDTGIQKRGISVIIGED